MSILSVMQALAIPAYATPDLYDTMTLSTTKIESPDDLIINVR